MVRELEFVTEFSWQRERDIFHLFVLDDKLHLL